MRDITSTVTLILLALWNVLFFFPQLPKRVVGVMGVILGMACISLALFWKIEVPISRTLDNVLALGSALLLLAVGVIRMRQSPPSEG